jgi:hypothetical protein
MQIAHTGRFVGRVRALYSVGSASNTTPVSVTAQTSHMGDDV